jgi:hypothetical protein
VQELQALGFRMPRRSENGHRIELIWQHLTARGDADTATLGEAMVASYLGAGHGDEHDLQSTLVDMLADLGHHARLREMPFEGLLQDVAILSARQDAHVALPQDSSGGVRGAIDAILQVSMKHALPVRDIVAAGRTLVEAELGPDARSPRMTLSPTAL